MFHALIDDYQEVDTFFETREKAYDRFQLETNVHALHPGRDRHFSRNRFARPRRDERRGTRETHAEPGGEPRQRTVPEQHQLQHRAPRRYPEHPEYPARHSGHAEFGLEPHYAHNPADRYPTRLQIRREQHIGHG